ncbi:serine threonine kinase [Apiospora arundinis]
MRPKRNNRPTKGKPEGNAVFALASIELIEGVLNDFEANGHLPANKKCFYNGLTTLLSLLKPPIKDQKEPNKSVFNATVEILNQLELLCSYGKGPSSKRPIPQRWPHLKGLSRDEEAHEVKGCIHDFFHTGKHKSRSSLIKRLKQSLEQLQTSQGDEKASTRKYILPSRPDPTQIREEDIHGGTEALYKALRSYHQCEREGSLGKIATQIRINGCNRLESLSTEFGVLFLSHPHSQGCRWKEAQISISKEGPGLSRLSTNSKPKVRFDVPGMPTSALAQSAQPTQFAALSCDDFCSEVSVLDQAQISLSAQHGQLAFGSRLETSREWLPDHQAISLAEIIRDRKETITDKMKTVLSYLLAKAVWQFYDSEFLTHGLTKDDVYFLFECRQGTMGVFIDEPMIVAQFASPPAASTQPLSQGGIHRMPKILALGIMLLEIETRTSIEEHRENRDLNPRQVVDMDTDYRIAKRLIDIDDSQNILTDMPVNSALTKVLPLCVVAGQLKESMVRHASSNKEARGSNQTSEIESIRNAIYVEIVEPLKRSRENFRNIENIKAIRRLSSNVPTGFPVPRRRMTPVIEGVTPQPHIKPRSDDRRLVEASRDWFREYDRLLNVLNPRNVEMGLGYKKVRVAVLDTGIQANDYDHMDAYDMMGGYRDFVTHGNDGSKQDEPGQHGSIAAFLLGTMCPTITLFLARVLETRDAREKEVQNVVDAIEWAIEKEVDIITMAIGFSNHNKTVEAAVRRARANGILIFSAASNQRNIGEICCPANMEDCVFGMFVANAGNREARELNPSMSAGNRLHCFAIFGEDLEWNENERLIRGSSYSTSMAAGLAALLLQFSRQKVDGENNNNSGHRGTMDLASLKDMRGMTSVFCRMSKKDGSCECIRPWSLLRSEYEPKVWEPIEKERSREQQRNWIRQTIDQCLANMYATN